MITQNILHFLDELSKNNNKEWFDANRKWYASVKKEYYDLATEILDRMKLVDESLEMVQAKDCVFRINRDIRFSKDKSPYKTNLGIFMAPYGRKKELAGYYIHIQQNQSFAGGGLYMPMPDQLKKVRREIHYDYTQFHAILTAPSFTRYYRGLDQDQAMILKNPPKEYSADDPAIEYLKYKSFTAVSDLDDKTITASDFTDKMVDMLTAIKPLITFLNEALLTDENGIRIMP